MNENDRPHLFKVTLAIAVSKRQWLSSPIPTLGDKPVPGHVRRWVEDHFPYVDSACIKVVTVEPGSVDKPIFVDTEAASLHCGHPSRTLYRWAAERRIVNYGGRSNGGARWDLRELPKATPENPKPAPPPRGRAV